MLDGECLWFGNRCCRRNGLVELSPEGLGGQAIPLFARESHGATPAAIGIGLCQGLCARPEDELITRSGISRAGHIRWHRRKCEHGLIELLDQRDFMQCPLRRRRLCNAWPAKSDLDAIWQLARGKRCRGRAPGLADRIRATAAQKREQRDQCHSGEPAHAFASKTWVSLPFRRTLHKNAPVHRLSSQETFPASNLFPFDSPVRHESGS